MSASRGSADPSHEYRRRLAERGEERARWQRRERAVSLSRLVTMVALLVVAWLAVQNRLFPFAWTLLPLAIFVVLVLVHRRVLEHDRSAQRAAEYYERGLARIEDRWHGVGPTGDGLVDAEHPYAADLDLFGDRSLFQLLCTARTRAGEARLAAWLCRRADRATLVARQEALAALRSRVDFREDMWRLGLETAEGVHPDTLIEWSRRQDPPTSAVLRAAIFVLAAIQIAGLAGWALLGWGPTLLFAALMVHAAGALFLRRRIVTSLDGTEGAGHELSILATVLERIEREELHEGLLRDLSRRLEEGGARPGLSIRRLQRLVDLVESLKNPMFSPIAVLLVWTPQLAMAIERWRREVGPQVATWVDVAAEVEALNSLAGYAFEHPDDPFPEIVETPTLEGTGLGHPLLAADSFTRNDIRLGAGHAALIVSGSNMSGKSTYLRTIGINTVLAMAGAPVRATHLRVSCLDIGASIQLHDSLQQGRSRFYAEILRLRQVLDLARGDAEQAATTLFLLDEILHGTNSHDRRIGAEALVRSLLQRGAIGLVTTHDLALADIAGDGDLPGIENIHFEDEIVDGRIVFDYRVRPGVVQKSNALALMREVGLEV